MGANSRASRRADERREEKKKATSKWLPSLLFVFRVLSSDNGWSTLGTPELGEFAEQLIDKKITTAIALICFRAQGDKWQGGMLKSGLADFLMRGFDAEDMDDAPSGFSVLFFHCARFSERDSADFVTHRVRETFGDGDLDNGMIKMFANLQIFIPVTVYEADEQLDTAIRFLKAICGENTIASGGFEIGRALMIDHQRMFKIGLERDRLILIKYLCFLDRIFQHFIRHIINCEGEPDPIQALRRTLRGRNWMGRRIVEDINVWILKGTPPPWGLPKVLASQSGTQEGLVDISRDSKAKGLSTGGKQKGGKSTGGSRKDQDKGSPSGGWHKLSESEWVTEWSVPEGKRLGDFFGSAPKKIKMSEVPKVPHHKTGEPSQLCLRYQLGNAPSCREGASCKYSHVRPGVMISEERERISNFLKRAYRAGSQA